MMGEMDVNTVMNVMMDDGVHVYVCGNVVDDDGIILHFKKPLTLLSRK